MCAAPSRNPDLATSFPGLWTLAQNYLSDAWEDMYGDPREALVTFRRHHPELASSAAAGVSALLEECASEEDRQCALDAIEWGYAPDPGELDAFLVWARDALRQQELAAG